MHPRYEQQLEDGDWLYGLHEQQLEDGEPVEPSGKPITVLPTLVLHNTTNNCRLSNIPECNMDRQQKMAPWRRCRRRLRSVSHMMVGNIIRYIIRHMMVFSIMQNHGLQNRADRFPRSLEIELQ